MWYFVLSRSVCRSCVHFYSSNLDNNTVKRARTVMKSLRLCQRWFKGFSWAHGLTAYLFPLRLPLSVFSTGLRGTKITARASQGRQASSGERLGRWDDLVKDRTEPKIRRRVSKISPEGCVKGIHLRILAVSESGIGKKGKAWWFLTRMC